MKHKKAFEIQFNWIFVLVAGAAILTIFALVIFKQKSLSESSTSSIALRSMESVVAGASATTEVAGVAAAPVIYIAKDQVAAGFAKGSVLLDGTGRNYMILAGHRDKPGMGEVHTLHTDIIYVQEGSAAFVTGGALVDAKTIEPNEIRGASIQGGEAREITKGDVIVVPKNTPHWFKNVKVPFTYFVVKVR